MPSAIAAATVATVIAVFPSAICISDGLRDDQWTLPVVEIADTLIWLAAGWHILFGRTAQRWTGKPSPVTEPATPR
jgi:hypothetical protein